MISHGADPAMTDSGGNQMAAELRAHLPPNLPRRENVIELSMRHIALLAEANQRLNLTAIRSPRELVIKHVLDSVLPAPLLGEARLVLDVGSGPGFPGIPLAIICPDKRFILAESVQKKARFLERVVVELGLSNVEVYAGRAETWLRSRRADAAVARAVSPVRRLLATLGTSVSRVGQLLLYKGPAGEKELLDARVSIARRGLRGEVALRYTLPMDMGSRCVLRLVAEGAPLRADR